MNFLIDIIIITIFLGTCVWGYKNGFIKAFLSCVKNIAAILIASFFSTKLGTIIYDVFLKKVFESFTVDKIAGWLGVEPHKNLDIGPLIDAEHSEFFEFLERMGFDVNTVTDKYFSAVNPDEIMVEYISKPLGHTVSNVIAFVLIFFVSVIVLKLLAILLSKIFSIPGLNITNKVLGLVFGVVLGLIFAFVFAGVVNALLPFIKIQGEHLSVGAIENGTFIYKYLAGQSPVEAIKNLLSQIGVNI